MNIVACTTKFFVILEMFWFGLDMMDEMDIDDDAARSGRSVVLSLWRTN